MLVKVEIFTYSCHPLAVPLDGDFLLLTQQDLQLTTYVLHPRICQGRFGKYNIRNIVKGVYNNLCKTIMPTSISSHTSGVCWHSLSKIIKSGLTFVCSFVAPALSILGNEVSAWLRSEFVGCVPDIISLSCYLFTLLEWIFEIYSFNFST